ncbi:MAG: UbiX family flavin prenyltransferase [Bacillota bacterium]
MRIIIGITGASGAIYGIRLLEVLRRQEIETHLIITDSAKKTISVETDYLIEQVEAIADFVYDNHDLGAPLASGSFPTDGMIIAPCSIKTVSALAHSYNDNLLVRAADVTLKEKRKIVVVPRETPLHLGHLRLLAALAELGAVIVPPVPAFYHLPKSIDDLINHTVGKILDQFGIKHQLFRRWNGI